ncbi:hypothetical protein [Streptomyces sp. H39-S7]|uniref:hypothetical protein n=1 Tax=Streptomyces sp. H39-S7 TaxID=3004357 RepID=UPI0022AFCA5C|nr:hypothetical protein [Streptomyces sp. H39-S7]MCZ4118979.1 hypothetical protein [Streptomyces sp. H39-S7]
MRRRLTEGCQLGVVPDSSVIHAQSPARDGRRLVVACSPEHLAVLRQEYRNRPYVPEELWAGQIDRALALQPQALTRDDLKAAPGLSHLEIQRALAWKRHRDRRRTSKTRKHPKSVEGPDRPSDPLPVLPLPLPVRVGRRGGLWSGVNTLPSVDGVGRTSGGSW